jgi:hypothetical protein
VDGRNTVAEVLHDVGIAAWFGGSLYGAAATNAASYQLDNAADRLRAANSAWARWTPINAAAIGAHVIGALGLVRGTAQHVVAESGMPRAGAVKTGFTLGALAATGCARVLGQKVMRYEMSRSSQGAAEAVAAEGATQPGATTPADVAKAQKQLKALQYAIPVLTGGVIVTHGWIVQSMRPRATLKQTAARLVPGA